MQGGYHVSMAQVFCAQCGASGEGDLISSVDNAIGGDGADTITGNTTANHILAGAGNDTVNAGSGDDTIAGDAGNDSLKGGDGDDTFYEDTISNGADTIDGEGGLADVVDYSGRTNALNITINDTDAGDGESGENDFVKSGTENAIGGHAADYIEGSDSVSAGNAGANELWGGDGNDTLVGKGGNDKLHGEGDNDSLDGDGGTDEIWGGEGNDVIHGDAKKGISTFSNAAPGVNADRQFRLLKMVLQREHRQKHGIVLAMRPTRFAKGFASAREDVVAVDAHKRIVAPNDVPIVIEDVLPRLIVILAVHRLHV